MSRQYLSRYDELYVISDLHLGGVAGTWIIRETARLANLIRWVAKRPGENVALVLNGDIIDSLAEPGLGEDVYAFLDPDHADQMLQRIFDDPHFSDVWQALTDFLKRPKRYLIIIVGNHDIEMALPFVQAKLRQQLVGSDPDAQLRLLFSTYGAGYGCLVGNARVFCTHGNEFDEWNWVDYSKLSEVANAVNAGRVVDTARWEPNAGTQLVVDAMNLIKRSYPFVDLLKPETNPVFGVLLTLAPESVLNKLDRVAPIFMRRAEGAKRRKNLLSADKLQPQLNEFFDQQLAAEIIGSTIPETDVEVLLLEIERAVGQGILASDAAERAALEGTLDLWDTTKGWATGIANRLIGKDKVDVLRQSLLYWLKDDTTFHVGSPNDSTYQRMMSRVGPDVNFVVTGHTHLARAIEVDPGRCYYFNCGTWIRLIRLTKSLLNDGPAFKKLYSVLANEDGTGMAGIDKATIPGPNGAGIPLVLDRTNIVRIATTKGSSGSVVGELLRVGTNEQGDDITTQLQEMDDWTITDAKRKRQVERVKQFRWEAT